MPQIVVRRDKRFKLDERKTSVNDCLKGMQVVDLLHGVTCGSTLKEGILKVTIHYSDSQLNELPHPEYQV